MKKLAAFLIGALSIFCVSNCGVQVEIASTHEYHKKSPKIVLLTIDGVRWQEIFNGTDHELYKKRQLTSRELVPNMYHYFIDEGSSYGKESPVIASGTAHISLPGYLEMMRGRPTLDCLTNLCDPELNTTLLDFFEEVAVFSSWDTVRKSTTSLPDRFVISAGRNYRSKNYIDKRLTDNQKFDCYVGHLDYRPDEFTIKSTFDYLSNEKPQFLWVSLGDTDEYAHSGNYEEYIRSLRKFDFFVGEIIREYDEETIFIVTTDHGRSTDWKHHGLDEESSKVWLMFHGKGIPSLGHVTSKKKLSLSNIMPTVLNFTHGIKSSNSII